MRGELRFVKSDKYLKQRLPDFLKGRPITPASARALVTGKRPRKYLRKDVAVAAVIRAISPKTFRLIRKNRWMQLPSDSTVRSWLKQFTIRDGFQNVLADIVTVKHPEPEAKEVFLSFDEMALRERWCYDKVELHVF